VTLLQLAVLAVVQGITEFLPISSSAHLVLVPVLFKWSDQGLILDVAVHVGTLLAVMLYLWRELWGMAVGLARLARGRRDPGAVLFFYLVAGTIPVAVAGLLLHHYRPEGIRSVAVIAWTTLGFGIVLYVADRIGMTLRRIEHLKLSDAVVIGIAQVVSLIPGTSRSGITMTAARLLGMERPDAARFSMLLSIPANAGAGVLLGWDLYKSGDAQLTANAAIAAVLAFVCALVAIFLMMAWLKRATFTPFVVYRILLGGFLLAFAYGLIGQ
jgi:undecaprenyl-diphosphatase